MVLNKAPDTKNLLRLHKSKKRARGTSPPGNKLLFSPDSTVETRNFLRLLCITEKGEADFDIENPRDKKLKVVEGKIATGLEWIESRAKQREEKEHNEKKSEREERKYHR